MEKSNVKNVGIWIRVSTEDQAKGESPEHHEKRARYYAESKDWKVKEVYHREAVTVQRFKIQRRKSPVGSIRWISLALMGESRIRVCSRNVERLNF